MTNIIYHVEGPRGFTRSFTEQEVDCLVAMGLVKLEKEYHDLEEYLDGVAVPIGPPVKHYGPA